MATIREVDVRRAAMDLLARREYSRQELEQKLIQKFSRRLDANRRASARHDVDPNGFKANSIMGRDSFAEHDEPADTNEGAGTPDLVEALVNKQLLQLIEENLQSDERFVESFINGRKAKGHGPQRIRYDLRLKGVSEGLLEQYLDHSDELWCELAGSVYFKKFGEGRPQDYHDKAKRMRFMQQRGFPSWMVEPLLNRSNTD